MTLEQRPPSFRPKHDRVLPYLRGGAVRAAHQAVALGSLLDAELLSRVGVEEMHAPVHRGHPETPVLGVDRLDPRRESGDLFELRLEECVPDSGRTVSARGDDAAAGRPGEGCGRHQLPMTAESQQRHPDLGVRHADRSVSARGHRVRTVGAQPTSVSAVASPSSVTVSRPSPRLPDPSDAVGARAGERGGARPERQRGRVPLVADERPDARSGTRPEADRVVRCAGRPAPAVAGDRCRDGAPMRERSLHGPGLHVDQPSASRPTSTASVPSGEISAPSTPPRPESAEPHRRRSRLAAAVPTGEKRDAALGKRDLPRRRAGRDRARRRAGAAVGHDQRPRGRRRQNVVPVQHGPQKRLTDIDDGPNARLDQRRAESFLGCLARVEPAASRASRRLRSGSSRSPAADSASSW